MDMIGRFLPNSMVIFLLNFFPTQAGSYILNLRLFCIQVLLCSFPTFPVSLPVNGWSRKNPVSTGTKNSIDFDLVESIILAPGNEAPGAMSHVEGSGWVRKPDGSKNADQSGNASFKSELYLSFMGVSRSK